MLDPTFPTMQLKIDFELYATEEIIQLFITAHHN